MNHDNKITGSYTFEMQKDPMKIKYRLSCSHHTDKNISNVHLRLTLYECVIIKSEMVV